MSSKCFGAQRNIQKSSVVGTAHLAVLTLIVGHANCELHKVIHDIQHCLQSAMHTAWHECSLLPAQHSLIQHTAPSLFLGAVLLTVFRRRV